MSTVALPALLGIHGSGGRALVAPGAIHAALTLARPQVNSRATALGPDDATLQIHGADTPRFVGSARRLLVEGQRSNDIADPLAFGAGSGWTALTGGTGAAAVVTPGYGGISAPDGSFTATRLQLSIGAGTTTADQSGLTRDTAASAARYVWARTLAGTANVQIGTAATAGASQSTVDTTWRRLGSSGAGGVHRIALVGGSGNSATADILVWGASVEANATFPSSLVLPPAGASQASTRGAELATASLAALGVAGNGACTLLWSGRLPQLATGTPLTILQVDDGTNTVRWQLDNQPTTANIRILGSGAMAVSAGAATAGAPLRIGVAIDGAGRAASSLNGAAAAGTTGGPTAGLTTLRLGANASAGNAMFGETAHLRLLPWALTDAELAAQVAALPT